MKGKSKLQDIQCLKFSRQGCFRKGEWKCWAHPSFSTMQWRQACRGMTMSVFIGRARHDHWPSRSLLGPLDLRSSQWKENLDRRENYIVGIGEGRTILPEVSRERNATDIEGFVWQYPSGCSRVDVTETETNWWPFFRSCRLTTPTKSRKAFIIAGKVGRALM
jgi:hypothetical protein